MKRTLALLREYKEMATIIAATLTILLTPIGRAAVTAIQPAGLTARVDSISHNVDVLVKLACLRDRDKWDQLDIAGIPCARLVSQR